LADRGGEGVEGDDTTVFLVRVVYGLFLRYDCRSVKLLLAGHGGEGRMRLDVTSVVESFVIGFAIVEIPSVVIPKKKSW
jgi:hypothetical protein